MGNDMSPSPPTARVVSVLNALGTCEEGSRKSAEIARDIGLSTSTTASILAELEAADYVERLADLSYRLGPALLPLLSALRRRYPLLGIADEALVQLAHTLGCGCTLARINSDDIEVIANAGPVQDLGHVGHRVPLDAPYGAFAVAWRPAAAVERWLAAAELSEAEAVELRSAIRGIRDLGYGVYSIDHDAASMIDRIQRMLSEVDLGTPAGALRAKVANLASVVGSRIYAPDELAERRKRPVSYVMAPVFGPDGQPRYLLTAHVMKNAATPDDIDDWVAALRDAAAGLTDFIAGGNPAAVPGQG